ncbi:MAG TPA: YIP1 family protein [Chloroflexota bacterium]|nr:YIP1 family protein [Chloroflexota bacterium]
MAYHDVLGDLPETPVGHDYDLARPVDSFVPTARAVAFQPAAFFAALPRLGNYLSPLVFALICAEVATVFRGILGLTDGSVVGLLFVSLIGTLIGGTIGLFILAGIAHLLVMAIVGPSRAGFEATFRAAAYASVTSLVSWIPVIGGLASLYGLYLAIVGIREVHQTTTGKAAAVVLIPIAVIVVLALVIGIIAGIAILSGMGGLQ